MGVCTSKQKKNQQKPFESSTTSRMRITRSRAQQKQLYQCPFCCERVKDIDLIKLQCQHRLHKFCIQKHIINQISIKKLRIICPMQNCQEQISIARVLILLDENTKQKFSNFTFDKYVRQHDNIFWCPTPGCETVFQRNDDEDVNEYNCISCSKTICLNCIQQIHYGMTCQQARSLNANKQFYQIAEKQKYRQCPNCRLWISRTSGCPHMVCICQTQFCYLCGKQYIDGEHRC